MQIQLHMHNIIVSNLLYFS